jgi:micrococcal nuclease
MGGNFDLVFDREKKDRYGRTLAYVYRSDGLLVNAELVKQGYAHVLYRFPNVSKATRFFFPLNVWPWRSGRGIWQAR